jgi:hypothetical protein
MTSALRTVLAVVAGMTLAVALVVAVEAFSALVHPLPAELADDIPEHVRRYPPWVLAVVVLLWGGTGAAATWLAARIGHRAAGIIAALVLVSALLFNISLLPYPIWFEVAMLVALPGACLAGVRYGSVRRAGAE